MEYVEDFKVFSVLVIFLALSCTNNKVSLDFSVGDCFVDMSNLAMTVDENDPEDRFNLETVEEVACSEPHNSEIYRIYIRSLRIQIIR